MHAMGLQKYRADRKGEAYPNGALPWFADWMGGPSLSKIEACPIEGFPHVAPRMAYITGEALDWGAIRAAIKYKGQTVRGYVSGANSEAPEGLVFRPFDTDKPKLAP